MHLLIRPANYQKYKADRCTTAELGYVNGFMHTAFQAWQCSQAGQAKYQATSAAQMGSRETHTQQHPPLSYSQTCCSQLLYQNLVLIVFRPLMWVPVISSSLTSRPQFFMLPPSAFCAAQCCCADHRFGSQSSAHLQPALRTSSSSLQPHRHDVSHLHFWQHRQPKRRHAQPQLLGQPH